jgi:hypothetical protein
MTRVFDASRLIVLALMSAPICAGESFRCGKWIASSDMTVGDLLAKCGEPRSRSRKTEEVMARNPNTGLMVRTGETVVETWIYDRGTTASPMVVTIVDGRIKNMQRHK